MEKFNVKANVECQMKDGVTSFEYGKPYHGTFTRMGLLSYLFSQDEPKPKYAPNPVIYEDENVSLKLMRANEKHSEEMLQFFGNRMLIPQNEEEIITQHQAVLHSITAAYEAYCALLHQRQSDHAAQFAKKKG